MNSITIGSIISITTFISFNDPGNLLASILLISICQIWFQFNFARRNYPKSIGVVIGSILVGNGLTLLFTTSKLEYKFIEGLFGFILTTLFYRTTPLLSLILSSMITNSLSSSSTTLKFLPGTLTNSNLPIKEFKLILSPLLLSLVGILNESLGLGRAYWWINISQSNLSWILNYLGPVGGDFLIGLICSVVVELGLNGVRRIEDGENDKKIELINLENEEEQEETNRLQSKSTATSTTTTTTSRVLRNIIPIHLLPPIIFILSLLLVSSFPTIDTFTPSHPSIKSPSFTYPPLSISCIAPRIQFDKHRKNSNSNKTNTGFGSVNDYLHESRVMGGRGFKVLVWNEGAVRLAEGGSGNDKKGDLRREDGWIGMGLIEREFLLKVGEICDQYQIYIAAAYILPIPNSHKSYNLVTLVGPTQPLDNSKPNIIFSQTKQNPIPFIESYTHSFKTSTALGNLKNQLPLAKIKLRNPLHFPEPRLLKEQEIEISSVICLDISFPNLVNSYNLIPFASDEDNSNHRQSSPSLILNPSSSPLHSLAQIQISQLQSRALEQNSFILRCDSQFGISSLISPKGEIRSLNPGKESWRSFGVDLQIERGRNSSWFHSINGEWSGFFLILLASGVYLVCGLRESEGDGKLLMIKGWECIRKRFSELRSRRVTAVEEEEILVEV